MLAVNNNRNNNRGMYYDGKSIFKQLTRPAGVTLK
jgi:hypothetical protein